MNALYYGDNLTVLRGCINDKSVDLIYLDPPFNSVMSSGNSDAAEMLRSMRSFLKENDMMAYLTMMAVRLLELNRVLKTTGSIYLHCDPTASHYLKLIMDSIFGVAFLRNEIIWKRTFSHGNASRRFGGAHDVILFYSRSEHII